MAISLTRSQQSIIQGYCLLRQAQTPIASDEIEKRLESIDSEMPVDASLRQFALADDVRCEFKARQKHHRIQGQLPLLVENHEGDWVLVFQQTDNSFLIKHFDQAIPETVSMDDFNDTLTGRTLKVIDREGQKTQFRFNARWFIPHLLTYKHFIGELLVSALCIQCLALCIPLFFQVVMDKVIVNQAYDTLFVIGIAMAMVVITEYLLNIIRQYLSTHTSTRIDAKLGALLYEHLLKLPLGYFKSRSVGVTVMRVSQLNSIREFMTGAANTLILDCLFLWVFFAVMFLYSPLLAAIVLATIPLCFLVVWIITPRLQARLMMLYKAAAINSAFLTESLSNIETVKAHAVERPMGQTFEHQARDTMLANFYVAKLMHTQDFWVQFFQKLALAGVIYFGAKMVIAVELTIGQLIAFNMMAQHAMQPILKLTQLWRDFVQTKVSLMQIGDVLNTHPESNPNGIDGGDINEGNEKDNTEKSGLSLEVENVSFRYQTEQPFILQGLSLSVTAGSQVAIIGESGSGKSTLVKLLQKLYVAESGRLTFDEQSIEDWNLTRLRRQIAVVSQETFLFNRTIRDNIALLKPKASLDDIIEVAKVARAHEFILGLDEGYNTLVEEGGHSLSGGQKQRIAIARALLSQPRVLVFDEATSALDESTQSDLMQQIAGLSYQPTQIYIAHRLSSIKQVDQIFLLKDGRVAESGSHESLFKQSGSLYRSLWESQNQLNLSVDSVEE